MVGKTGAMDRKTQLQETKILSMRHMEAGGKHMRTSHATQVL